MMSESRRGIREGYQDRTEAGRKTGRRGPMIKNAPREPPSKLKNANLQNVRRAGRNGTG